MRSLLILLLALTDRCLGQQVKVVEAQEESSAWPKTSVWLVAFGRGEGTQLVREAAQLLAAQDFSCTLLLVGADGDAPSTTNALVKTVNVKIKEAPIKQTASGSVQGDSALAQGEVEAHLAACEALLLESTLLAQLKSQPPKVIIFPGFLHDACILPLLTDTAAVVVSTGSISSAWLGHATNTVPFSPSRPPLQEGTNSMYGRAIALVNWNSFLKDYEQKYWNAASQLVANRTEKPVLSVDDAYQKVAFLASGSHALLESPAPSLSLKVPVGCFHCRHANAFPQELQEWILPRRSGLIAISLPPNEKISSTLAIIAREMPQFGFLWLGVKPSLKKEDELPSNIVFHDQVTDQDALGHPRARLLISQCSEILVLSAMFHGVPLVCLPETWEQKMVAERVRELEIGFPSNPDPMKLASTIQTLVENQNKYRSAARHLGVMIRDEPETASDRLTFWVGHTARHWGHGHDNVLQEVRKRPRDVLGLFDVGFVCGASAGLLLAVIVATFKVLISKRAPKEEASAGGNKKGKKGE